MTTRQPSDPVGDAFQPDRHARERATSDKILSGALIAGALVVYPPIGVAAIVAKGLEIAAAEISGRPVERLLAQTAAMERRLAALEAEPDRAERITGARLQLLRYVLEVELTTLWAMTEAADAQSALALEDEEFAEAAEELQDLGLVIIDANANAPHGIGRVRLAPMALLRVGPQLQREVDFASEIGRVLARIAKGGPPGEVFQTATLVAESGIPLPRLELLLQAMEQLDLITGQGPGSEEFGSWWCLSITPRGRRVLRGDAPVPLP